MIFNSDHPSRCGENRLYLTSESTRSGSSPRTRGKPCVLRHTHLFNGITPAGAGKTSPQFAPQGRTQGSPPQVRGKHLGGAPYSKSPRITPAGAGKTTADLPPELPTKDHPRRCGENLIIPPFPILSTGSPPQVRGKQPPSAKSIDKHRITPAGAGKTVFRFCDRLVFQDHPRRCGENFQILEWL